MCIYLICSFRMENGESMVGTNDEEEAEEIENDDDDAEENDEGDNVEDNNVEDMYD